MTFRIILVVMFIGLWSGVMTSHAADPSLDELIEAHSSAFGLIRQVDLEIQSVKRPSKNGEQPVPQGTYRWSSDGRKHRYRIIAHAINQRSDGWPVGHHDEFTDETSSRVVTHWDPKSPKQPTLLDTGPIKAQYDEGPATGPLQHASWFLMLRFAMPGQPAVPLKDFIAAVPKDRIQFLGANRNEGRLLYGIKIELTPNSATGEAAHWYEVFLDPAANYFVAKYTNHMEGSYRDESTGEMKPYSADFIWRVTKFQDHSGGVWLPVEVESREWRYGQLVTERQVDVKVLNAIVNKPLPSDALDFKFPENVLVTRVSREGGILRQELWGPDNKPIREITTPDDLNKLMAEAVAAVKAGHRSPRTSYVWAWGMGLIALVLIVGYRMWRNRA